MGYVIQHVHEVYHFEETRRGLFAEYVNTWLKIKVEASGWPSGCDTEEQRQAYVEDFERHEGIQLDLTKIAYNPGRRSLAKLMLISLWGKFGQRDNLMRVFLACRRISFPHIFSLVRTPEEYTFYGMLLKPFKKTRSTCL